MPSLRLRHLATTAFAALAISTSAVATAAPASAAQTIRPGLDNNNVIIRNVTLAEPNKAIAVEVTYICEPSPKLSLGITWRLADERDSQLNSPRGVLSPYAITCDEQAHDARVIVPKLWGDSLPFGKGDPVLTTAQLSNFEGLPYAETRRVSTL
ncbi:hypothetical protein [Streptomyces sp. NPDC003077]|uniref:hypothetical protein n=1 Tax=Streptomyces sp. NPDC003077 TaxID=3154443 RepID=UPI0033AD7B6C